MIKTTQIQSGSELYLKATALPILAVIPSHFKSAAWVWFWLSALASLVGMDYFTSKLFIPVALFCYWVLLTRPMRESPFALLLLATGASEILIFLGPLFFLGRAFLQGKVYIPKKLYGYLFLTFLLSVLVSVFLSWTTIEFRPLQTVFWCVTFLAPLSIGLLGFRVWTNPEAVARYAIFLIVLEIIPVIAQIPAFIHSGSPDVIHGTWMDADIVGFWTTSLFMGMMIWYIRTRNASFWKASKIILIGMLMSMLASGKAYSGCIIIAAFAILLLSLDNIRKVLTGNIRNIFFMAFLVLAAGVVLIHIYQVHDFVYEWTTFQMEHSKKTIFLDRVFFRMNDYGYSDLLGAGPGMLGSRAANSVSASVLTKAERRIPDFLMNAPIPESRVMNGLFTPKFLASIHCMSATLVFPFSGVGAVKGELGWIGLLLILALMMARFWPIHAPRTISHCSNVAFWMVGCAGIGMIGLAMFDTVWEMPKIMVFLNALTFGLKRVSDVS